MKYQQGNVEQTNHAWKPSLKVSIRTAASWDQNTEYWDVSLTIRLGQSGETVNLFVFDQIGKASEKTATEFTFKDRVHFFQENVF